MKLKPGSAAWLDIRVKPAEHAKELPSLEFYDSGGNLVELHGSHAEIIALAVLGNLAGHPAFPYIYDGVKCGGGDKEFTQLDNNHSHYICVDDGSNGKFGSEVVRFFPPPSQPGI